MRKPYKAYICQTLSELNDRLGSMILSAPSFKDNSGYIPEQNIETTFEGLNNSLDNLRGKLGEERYATMREMSDRMRALFDADPDTKTGETIAGVRMLQEMQKMLRRKRTAPS